jgi:hypothetical protein
MIGAQGAGLKSDERQPRPDLVFCADAEMGDALPPVRLGTNRFAVYIAAASSFTCVILVSSQGVA